MKKSINILGSFVAMALGAVQIAQAHTSLDVKEAAANSTFLATFNVGHGCEVEGVEGKLDTYKVVLDIPDDLSVADTAISFTPNIRALDEAWGTASVVKNTEGKITQVVWMKTGDFTLREDEASYFYQTHVRLKIPNKPFTKITFPAITQYCKNGEGPDVETPWKDYVDSAGKAVNNAPKLTITQEAKYHLPGWNKFPSPMDMDEAAIKTFFSSALIVWVGDAAYSSNTLTASSITKPLTSISKDADIWVKY